MGFTVWYFLLEPGAAMSAFEAEGVPVFAPPPVEGVSSQTYPQSSDSCTKEGVRKNG